MNHNLASAILSKWLDCNKVAIKDNHGNISYNELILQVKQFAGWIVKQGLEPGDRVVLSFPDSIKTVTAFLGTIWAGGIPCVINAQSSPTNFSFKINLIQPKFVFKDTNFGLDPDHVMDEAHASSYKDTACLIWSSGTGGHPKAIMIPHGPMLQSVKNYVSGIALTQDDIIYCTAKLFFSYGIYQTIFSTLWLGATSIIDHGMLMPSRIEKNIKRYSPSIFLSVPVIYGIMLGSSSDTFAHTRCISSGDILPDSLNNKFKQRFGRGIHSGLGTTETLHIITLNQRADCGIGRAFPGWETRLVDNQGSPVAAGEIGFLQIKTECCAVGYLNDLENTNRVFGKEWLSLGDMCIEDENGNLTYVGRSGDLVKFNGQYANLVAIESLFLTHPDVEQVVVVAKTDDLGQSKVSAHVVVDPHSHIDSDELKIWIRKNCVFDYVPSIIHILKEIPRNENGKINRTLLRNQYA
jgi:benzoate-CoA ligase